MAQERNFWRNTDGGMVEKFAIMAGVCAIAALASAQALKVVASNGGLPTIVVIRGDDALARTALNLPKAKDRSGTPSAQPGVDYSPSATIRAQAGQVMLDPCTGKPK